MANQKITQETALTGASLDRAADVFPIVDVSAGTSGNRKMTPDELMAGTPATSSTPGSMSAADKTKLDSINTTNLVTTNTNQTITGTKTISTQNIAVSSSKPSAPSSGNVLLSATDISGRPFPIWQTPDGREYIAQTGLARNRIVCFMPADGSSINTYGQFASRVGTTTHNVLPTDDLVPYMSNISSLSINNTQITPNTTNIFASLSSNKGIHCRGTNAKGHGGFFFYSRIYLPDASYPTARIYVGMYTVSPSTDNKGWWDGYITSTDNPDGNFCGFQYSSARGDTTWQFTTKDGTTQNVTAITGATFAVQKLLDFYIYCPRAGSTISYRLDNLTDDVTYTGSTSTNLPGMFAYMNAGIQLRSTQTAGASNIRWEKLYIE